LGTDYKILCWCKNFAIIPAELGVSSPSLSTPFFEGNHGPSVVAFNSCLDANAIYEIYIGFITNGCVNLPHSMFFLGDPHGARESKLLRTLRIEINLVTEIIAHVHTVE